MSYLIRPATLAFAAGLCAVAASGDRRLTPQVEASRILALAESSAEEMAPGYLRDFAVTEVVKARARAGEFGRALSLAKLIEHLDERDLALGAIVHEWLPRNSSEALRTSQGMANLDLRGLAQGEVALWQVRTGNLSRGLDTANAIEDEGRRFSAVCAIAAELFRQRRASDAEALVTRSSAIGTVLQTWHAEAADMGLEGLGRDIVDAKLIAFILQDKAKEPIEVEDIHRSIYDYAESLHEIMQLGELIGLKDRAGDRAAADRVLDAFVKAVEPGEDRDVSLSQLGTGMALVDDTEGALRVALLCKRPEARGIVYLAIVTARAQAGDLPAAETARTLITTQPAKLGALVEMARLLAPKHRVEAVAYLKRAEAEALVADASDPHRYYLASMARAYASLGNRREALAKLARLERTFGNRPTFEPAEMVDLYLAAGDVPSARRWALGDIQTFAAILEYQNARRDFSGARTTANLAHRSMEAALPKTGPNEDFGAVCRAEARLMDPAAVAAWAQSLPSAEARVYTLVGIAQGLMDRSARVAVPPTERRPNEGASLLDASRSR